MKGIIRFVTLAGLLSGSLAASSQTVVVHDPTTGGDPAELTAAEQAIFDRQALPRVRKAIPEETCGESLQPAGVVRGAFTAKGKRQSLVFYEYCQTGNGFGWNGLVLIEGDKVVGNFISDGGWGVDIGSVPDINENGILEFTLSYSGGMHQGQGGTGVELMEFSGGKPVGIGWYKAEAFGPTEAVTSWKLTAKPGTPPTFYKQKFFSGEGRKPKAVGKAAVTRLDKAFVSKFEAVK